MEAIKGIITNVLEKKAEPVASKFAEFIKENWEKFKVDSDMVFKSYLENAYEKYSKIKTILYKNEPKYIYDFFEYPLLIKSDTHITNDWLVESEDINNLLDISHFLIIEGTGGIGKSTFMKHLFLNELSKKDLIPIFIELKDLNDCNSLEDFESFALNKLNILNSSLDRKYMMYALSSGCFLFLLDGYDEIMTDKKDAFFKSLSDFCDHYPQNYYIISSRPISDFIEFQRFSTLKLCNFTKEQSISLIKKIDFDTKIKERFILALSETLYEKHRSFASNPLLLNIMLLTYDNYADIPEKVHLFYEEAFNTLYARHDATKGGYKREIRSGLSIDQFKKFFSKFCFVSYVRNKIEFSFAELLKSIEEIKINGISINGELIIEDLLNSVCLMYKEGLQYTFSHRSFQEYFTAYYMKEMLDDDLTKYSMLLIENDSQRCLFDNVFKMLFDMSRERTEQKVILPLLEKIESSCDEDKYDFYFKLKKIIISCDFVQDFDDEDDDIKLLMLANTGDHRLSFITNLLNPYLSIHDTKESDEKVITYIMSVLKLRIGEQLSYDEIIKNPELYLLIKESWIGKRLQKIAELKEVISNKKINNEIDLEYLLKV